MTAARPYRPSVSASLTNRLKYWDILEGVVFSYGAVSTHVEFGMEFRPPSGIDVTDEQRTQLAASMRTVLVEALPERCRARVIVECQRLSNEQLMTPVYEDVSENALMAEMAAQERLQAEAMRMSGELRSWRYFFTVRMPEPEPSLAQTIRGYLRRGQQVPFTQLTIQPHLERARLTRNAITAVMQAAGFDCTPMDDQAAFELIWRYLNPDFATAQAPRYLGSAAPLGIDSEELKKSPYVLTRTLREQLAESECDPSMQGALVLGSQQVFAISIRGTGNGTSPGMIEPLLAAMSRYTFYYILDCYHDDQIKRRKALSERVMQTKLNAEDQTLGMSDIGNQATYDSLASTVYSLTSSQEHVYTYGMALVVFTATTSERETALERARTMMSMMGGASVITGTVQNIPQVLDNLAPFSGQDNCFMYDVISGNAADMMPLVAPYVGSLNPLVVLTNRMGTQTGLNPSDGTDNAGTLVIGGSGSGKTMITQKLLMAIRRTGGSLMIVDQKSDYRVLVEMMEGQFVNFAPGERITVRGPDGLLDVPVRFNAFAFPGDDNLEAHQSFVMGLLSLLLGADIGGMSEAILSQALTNLYEVFGSRTVGGRRVDPTLSDYLNSLMNLNRVGTEPMTEVLEKLASALRVSLSRYAGDGPMGVFLDGQSTFDLDGDVSYFNVSAIRDNEKLRPIVLMLVAKMIWKRAVKDPTQIKAMVIEELGVLLQIPAARDFVNQLFKLGRAYKFWPIAVSQEVRDFEMAEGLINNMSQVIVGKLAPNEAKKLVQVLNLDPEVENLINSLSGVKGVSKEYLLLRFGTDRRSGGVVTYRPTSVEYWTTTSAPDDRAIREQVIAANGGNKLAAIRTLARTHP